MSRVHIPIALDSLLTDSLVSLLLRVRDEAFNTFSAEILEGILALFDVF